MAKQTIAIGTTANDGTGDLNRDCWDKVNDNFTELYNRWSTKTQTLTVGDVTISSSTFTPAFISKPFMVQVWDSAGILQAMNITVTFNTPNYDIIISDINEQLTDAIINVLL